MRVLRQVGCIRIVAVLVISWLAVASVSTQPEPPPIWKGVYSQAQAERGKAVVARHCTRCHGAQRPLSGDLFMLHWEGHTLARLWRRINETMPVNAVESVSEAEKLDSLAFVLQANGFPSGESEMTGDLAALSAFRVLPREGPRPLKTGMTGEIVGCLTKGTGSAWVVTNATEPVTTTIDVDADVKAASETPLGANTFELIYHPATSADPLIGKKVLIRALVIRRPAGDRLNVFTLDPVGAECGK